MASATNDAEFGTAQEKWRSGLEDYLKAHGQSADAPEAALRLAIAYELAGGKDMTEVKANEAKARQWYDHLVKNFGTHQHAAKAAAVKDEVKFWEERLAVASAELEGRTADLRRIYEGRLAALRSYACHAQEKRVMLPAAGAARQGVTVKRRGTRALRSRGFRR